MSFYIPLRPFFSLINLSTPLWKTNFYTPFWNGVGHGWGFASSNESLYSFMKKKKIYNPFLELDESWVRPQANLNIPIWKTNFYTSFWNWRISIPLYEKQISILLLELTLFCGWERKTIRLTTSNEFQYSFMESKFLYSFLELDESWVRPQTNFNTPLWKTNFYTPFSN